MAGSGEHGNKGYLFLVRHLEVTLRRCMNINLCNSEYINVKNMVKFMVNGSRI